MRKQHEKNLSVKDIIIIISSSSSQLLLGSYKQLLCIYQQNKKTLSWEDIINKKKT